MRNRPFHPKLAGLLFGFLLLFSVFIPITQAQSQTQNINLNGLWKSSTGAIVDVRQSGGGGIVGLIKQTGSSSLDAGSTNIDGSIKNNTFVGSIYLRALTRSCSFLDGLYAATGTVSPDGKSISFTFEDRKYNAETCDFTGEVGQGTITYTRLLESPSPTLTPTVVPTSSAASPQAERNSPRGIDIPGYTQALVDKPPEASDFQNIPQSDFTIVSPAGKAPATQKPATESASTKDSIFIGKVGDKGEVVLDFPNRDKISLTDDRSGIDFFNTRFGATLPGPEMGNPTKLTIREVDCHIIASRNNNGNCDSTGRCIYPDIWDAQTRIDKTVGDCTYLNDAGPARVLVEQGNVTFKTPGGIAVAANNADFGIGYDIKSGTSVVEIYDGSIIVTGKSGQSKKISTAYGSRINRIEDDKNGIMTEKIAIPQSQWEAFLASQQEKEVTSQGSLLPIVFTITLLGAGGIIFFLYRTGKIMPFYNRYGQRIFGLFRKTNSKNPEKEEN